MKNIHVYPLASVIFQFYCVPNVQSKKKNFLSQFYVNSNPHPQAIKL